MLRPDPKQQARLVEIQDNLKARLVEAKNRGWLGEIEGLEVSLAGVDQKLETMKEVQNLPIAPCADRASTPIVAKPSGGSSVIAPA